VATSRARTLDVGDGVLQKAGLPGDGLRDGAIEERHADPLGNPRPDDSSARPKRAASVTTAGCWPLVLISLPLPGKLFALVDGDRHRVGVGAERRVQEAEDTRHGRAERARSQRDHLVGPGVADGRAEAA